MAVLSLGHLSVDLCQGALPALLPFLIAEHGWSYGQAAALVLASACPRRSSSRCSATSPTRARCRGCCPPASRSPASGISLAGIMGSYPLTFAVVVVSGLGVAAYHPEGSRFANYVSGARRATGMSLFSVGGNAGLALGPAIVTPLALALGLAGTPLIGLLPLPSPCCSPRELRRLQGFKPVPGAGADGAAGAGADQWRPFVRLALAIAARSIVFFGLMTLVPLYFVDELGASEATANTALTVMLASGAVGTLIGGRLADRFGRRIVLRVSLAALTPLIVVFLMSAASASRSPRCR